MFKKFVSLCWRISDFVKVVCSTVCRILSTLLPASTQESLFVTGGTTLSSIYARFAAAWINELLYITTLGG